MTPLSLGLPNMVLSVLLPLKCTCIPFLLHIFLNFSPVPGMYGTTMVMFFLLLLLSCRLLLLLGLLLLIGWLGLISDLRTKYGEESVNSIRKWEITVKKMADYRNHRRFTLRCIKASITPVSCKLKNSLSSKSRKSYQIIHKTKKQILYEWIRNINYILEKLDKQRESQYKKFKDTLFKPNLHVQVQDLSPEADLERSRLFINKIKGHRHNKIKGRHIDKFEHLFFKCYGYFVYLTR